MLTSPFKNNFTLILSFLDAKDALKINDAAAEVF